MSGVAKAPGLLHTYDGVTRPLRILHVTECFGAGVGRAVRLRAQALPGGEHHLLWAGQEAPLAAQWASETELPAGGIARMRAVRRRVDELGPDLIHAHSSWAGAYTRIRRLGAPVVYEPHCFKFDDPALWPPARRAFTLAERALLPHTAAVGVLSPHERRVVREMSPTAPIVEVPNIPTIALGRRGSRRDDIRRMTMVGRLVPQKDPQFFADVAWGVHQSGIDLEAVWIGDGDTALRQLLSGAGIRVTGWRDPAGVENLVRGSVYIHTARYEGFPLSLLDAAACEAPIVARRIPAIEHTGLLMADTPKAVAALVIDILRSQDALVDARTRNLRLLREHSQQKLTDALVRLYTEALRA